MPENVYKVGVSLKNEDLLLNETLFHNANGYLGIRSCFEEDYAKDMQTIRGTYINGFYDFANMKQAEKLYGFVEEKQTIVNIADTQGICLYLGDEKFSMFSGKVLDSKRVLDMDNGFTQRIIHWRSEKGKEIIICIKRMTSFDILPLFTIDYEIKSINYSGPIRFESEHIGHVSNYENSDDPRVAGEAGQYINVQDISVIDEASYIVSKTSKSGLTVCSAVFEQVSKQADIKSITIDTSATKQISCDISEGESFCLVKYSVFCDSVRYKDCFKSCAEILKKSVKIGIQALYKMQWDYLNDYWDNAYLKISGDDDLNISVKFNMYQLLQSVGKDRSCNISAKGLSGEGYEGHYFWDTEMYIQPFFVLTSPHITKNLIEYRYSILDFARENARILGHKKGALFPWRTIMGKECSGYFPAGSAQYHINGDIAYSVVSYYLLTKDIEFIANVGAEIVFETARLWMDAGNFSDGMFMINEVTGPDEYTCLVNNNYYTNATAKYNLYWAVKFYDILSKQNKINDLKQKINLTEHEIAEFSKAEAAMYLPYDERFGINPQDDSFLQKPVWDFENTPKDKYPLLLHYHPLYLYRHQVCKQADTVFAHFIFEDYQSVDIIKNSFLYYENVTTHDSSLSKCIFSIVASKINDINKALLYLGDSAKLDLFNTHGNTKDGIHTANMGGNYMAIVYGFGGVRIKESGLYLAPTKPDKWDMYEFKLFYEESRILVSVYDDYVEIRLESGAAKRIFVYEKEYVVESVVRIGISRG